MKGTGPLSFDNPLDGLRYARIPDPDRHTTLLIMYPLPLPDNPWGVMAPIRETNWGAQMPIVTGEVLSHALHGHPKPFREMLGNPPRIRARQVPLEERICLEAQQNICANAGPHCRPGSKALPECYVAPSADRVLRALGNAIGRAWDEGRYVFVVEGPEFVVR